MKRLLLNLGPALMAAVVTALLVTPIFGLQLQRVGGQMRLDPHWNYVLWATLIVFVVQICKPALKGAAKGIRLPSIPSLPAKLHNALIFAALLLAISWPFFAGRNAIDIATLAMIYVMLGLGLNIVVGFAGLLDLGLHLRPALSLGGLELLGIAAAGRGCCGAVWLFAGLSRTASAR